ncbi:MAG: heme o synthase [Pseudomonadota bacterium]
MENAAASPATTPADFLALLKPRVMSLVVFTGAVGVLVAPGNLHPVLALVAILCIAVGAGASGCINMWYERDVDAIMRRTRNRPIPAGRMAPRTALEFGVTLAVGSVAFMGLAVNWTAAGLLALAIAFYVFVYTVWLKRRTPHNIVIGGAAGAFPPMIGWAAVTGDVSMASIVLFAIIFFWTPPHFWSLALYRAGDYEKAGIPMLPVVAGAAVTRRQILLYAFLMLPLTMLPWVMGFAGPVYGVGAALLGLVFIWGALRIVIDKTDQAARWMFRFSILYLALIFGLLVVDNALHGIV